MARRLAFLGPRGTFSEEAALLYDSDAEAVPCATVAQAARAVAEGRADEAILPIENSLEGTVTEAVDVLVHESDLAVRGEMVLKVRLYLLAPAGVRLEDVRAVYSHPQPLAQCRHFIEERLPRATVEAALSTAVAVEQAMARTDAAAIGNRRAAALYGAETLAEDVQDSPINQTRFAIVGAGDHDRTGRDKTSIAFAVAHDKPGTLVGVLQEFSKRKINLTKIESRPSKRELGVYIFLVDLEGHRLDPPVAEALAAVKAQSMFFKVLGSYPRFQPAA